jgi:NitT/TauT family transport system substrate-binding protein
VAGFLRAVRAAQSILLTSDAEWDRLRPKMRVNSDAEFQALRRVYREGALLHWGPKERADAGKLFAILTSLSGSGVVKAQVKFDKAVFWGPLVF